MNEKSNAEITKGYYDSLANELYKECWGGENHHMGIFDHTDDFYEAAQRANENLVGKLRVKDGDILLDIGSGFCGLPRYIVANTPVKKVYGLNISEKENEYAREKNRKEGLDDRIEVIDGDFHDMPFKDESFDVMVSQESMLHSPDEAKMLRECARVLKKGGHFVFSDILEMPGLTREEAEKVYARIQVPYLGTFDIYKEELPKAGFEIEEIQDLGSSNIAKSYQSVHDNLKAKKEYLVKEKNIPEEMVDNTLNALQFWVDKASEGKIGWGLFSAVKK